MKTLLIRYWKSLLGATAGATAGAAYAFTVGCHGT